MDNSLFLNVKFYGNMLINKKICGCDMKPRNCVVKTEFVSCSFISAIASERISLTGKQKMKMRPPITDVEENAIDSV